MQSATQLLDLHIWRDDRSGQLWRVRYNEGDGETNVSFPDTAALGDFLRERLGLALQDEEETEIIDTNLPVSYHRRLSQN